MHRLMDVIGKAPSEMTEEELENAITRERQRVSRVLAEFKAGNPKKAKLREDTDD